MNTKPKTGRRLLCAASLALLSASASAQSYPSKPIRFVVPFAPGGSGDLVARVIGKKLNDALKVPLVVENQAGAGGVIGAQAVARAAADGYTILLGTQSSQVIVPVLQRPAPYDPINDFTPIARLVLIPLVMTAHPSVPATNLKELIEYARTRPGALNYGSTGAGTSSHLAGELFNSMAKVQVTHIPYKGGGPATADLLAGHIQLLFGSISTTLPYLANGKLRALGVTDARRSPAAPNIPTIGEQLPGYVFSQWLGVLGPPAMPANIVRSLNGEINKALGAPDVVENFRGQGLDPAAQSPEEFATFISADVRTMGALVKFAKLAP